MEAIIFQQLIGKSLILAFTLFADRVREKVVRVYHQQVSSTLDEAPNT